MTKASSSGDDDDDSMHQYGTEEEEKESGVPLPDMGLTNNTINGQIHLLNPLQKYGSGSQKSFSRSRSMSDTLANQLLERPNDGGFETRAQSFLKKNVQWGLNSNKLRHLIRSPPPDIEMFRDVVVQSHASPGSSRVTLASSQHKSNLSPRVSFHNNTAGDDNSSTNVYQQYEQRLSHIVNSLQNKYSRNPNKLHKLNSRLDEMRAEISEQYAFKNEKEDEPIFDGQDSDFSRFQSKSYNINPEGIRPVVMAHSSRELFSQPEIPLLLSPRRSSLGFEYELDSSSSSAYDSDMSIPPALETFRKLDQQIRELEDKVSDVSTKHEFWPPSNQPDHTLPSVVQSQRNSLNSKAQLNSISNQIRELETQISALSTRHISFHPLSQSSDKFLNDYIPPHIEQEADIISQDQSNAMNSIHPSQNQINSIHPSQNQMNSIYPSQNQMNSIHPSQNPIKSNHPSPNPQIMSSEKELRNRHPGCLPSQSEMVCCRQVYQPQSYCTAMMPPQVMGALICIMLFLISWVLFCSYCYDVNSLLQNHQHFKSNTDASHKKNFNNNCPLKEPELKITFKEIASDKLAEQKNKHDDGEGKESQRAGKCKHPKTPLPDQSSPSRKWFAYTFALHDRSEND